jgi:hypothetical protein
VSIALSESYKFARTTMVRVGDRTGTCRVSCRFEGESARPVIVDPECRRVPFCESERGEASRVDRVERVVQVCENDDGRVPEVIFGSGTGPGPAGSRADSRANLHGRSSSTQSAGAYSLGGFGVLRE